MIPANDFAESHGAPIKALLASKDLTLTMLFPAEKPATATILLIPGGDGYLPLRLEATETKNPWFLGIFGPLISQTGIQSKPRDQAAGLDPASQVGLLPKYSVPVRGNKIREAQVNECGPG